MLIHVNRTVKGSQMTHSTSYVLYPRTSYYSPSHSRADWQILPVEGTFGVWQTQCDLIKSSFLKPLPIANAMKITRAPVCIGEAALREVCAILEKIRGIKPALFAPLSECKAQYLVHPLKSSGMPPQGALYLHKRTPTL